MATPFDICFLNGNYVPLRDARISPLDRGFLFGDSVYEVIPVFDGKAFLLKEHFERLERSLKLIRVESLPSFELVQSICTELVRLNGIRSAYIYLQVTRGMEYGRNHAFPASMTPTVFAMASPLPELTQSVIDNGLSAITVEDFRWGRCDIKATTLLANILMKQQAADAGAQEAIIVRDGEVLEGSSSSVFAIFADELVTPPNSHRLLPGTTREAALRLANSFLKISVRSLSIDELRAADEIWIGAATRDVVPVCRLDSQAVGQGKPGKHWQQMRTLFSVAHAKW
jgi:D-alanine transaminase